MQLTDFQFPFDPTLVATSPVRPRDHAKLLVVTRGHPTFHDYHIFDLPQLLQPGDLVVVNDTRVVPARVLGTKLPSGGKVEMLVLRSCGVRQWEVMLKGRVRVGQRIRLEGEVEAVVEERSQERTVVSIKSALSGSALLHHIGQMPLPPYIKRQSTEKDREDYQTMFAQAEGAIAAPTAGLHFTPELLKALTEKDIHIATITLHVGPGTFRPVTVSEIEAHRMDPEWFHIPEATAHAIARVKQQGGRVVAVGTTVTRSLESAVDKSGQVRNQEGQTCLFITPGYRFRVVDVLMTNFHLPGTTLLMLLAAFAGLEQSRAAYEHAVNARYRFYSYGDAMLIQ
ncbi:MAG: S-adenosylmethionine:tRNA ribosyltransferase-isomerase [Nitrospirales bacterium]|nr:MAG: S-adenosylmethionine:tRNA ribosyltransferase-isomerase [Nitrospirales bacterium]